MKKILTVLVALSILLSCAVPVSIVSAEDTYVEVATAADFLAQVNANSNIRLADNINLGNWTPAAYSGKLDGNGKTLTFTINSVELPGVGLFSKYSGSEVKDLTLAGSVTANYTGTASYLPIGALAGIVSASATISNCVNKASISTTSWYSFVGGFIGTTDPNGGNGGWGSVAAALVNCRNEGNITGRSVAGLVGVLANKSSITCSANIGNVTGAGDVAGFVGRNFGKINKSYNIGKIERTFNNTAYVAAGFTAENVAGSIVSCYNAGVVKVPEGNIAPAGFIGKINTASVTTINSCYNVITGINPFVTKTGTSLTINNSYYLTADNVELDQVEGTAALTISQMRNMTALSDFEMSSNRYGFPQIKENINTLEGLYSVEITAENGTATPIVNYVKGGTALDVTYAANEGLTLASVTANGTDITGDLKNTTSGTYTYTVNEDTNLSFVFNDGSEEPGDDDIIDDGSIPVASAADFMAIANNPSGFYRITKSFTLGSKDAPFTPFEFSGKLTADPENMPTITVYANSSNPVGLFSVLSGNVENIIVDGEITGNGGFAGGIAGKISGKTTTITNCINKATIDAKSTNAGGFVGAAQDGYSAKIVITSCINNGKVNGTTMVGGIIGQLPHNESTITLSANNGSVSGNGFVGGLVGRAYNSKIEKSYNTGAVNTTGADATYASAGGILGLSVVATPKIDSCYNIGEVTSKTANVGGIVGKINVATTVTDCYTTNGNIAPASANLTITDSYYVTETGTEGDDALTYAELKNAAALLGENFVASENNYLFPQIADNVNDMAIYEVTVSATNGSVSPAVSYVKEGNSIEINYTADEGVKLAGITANNVDVTGELKDTLSGKYTFTPSENTNVVFIFNDGFTRITSAEEFLAIKNAPTGSYKLMNNITLGSKEESFVPFDFSGTLVGDAENMPVITVYINNTDTTKPTGLFSKISGNVVIKNLVIDGVITAKGDAVGGIAGKVTDTVKGSEISNCINKASVTTDGYYAGGIVGMMDAWNNKLALTGLKNEGSIYSVSYAGGIAGMNKTEITLSVNTGDVTHSGGGTTAGGIAARCYGKITKSYNAGKVTGSARVGGICGYIEYENVQISDCYNVGTIESKYDKGDACGIGIANPAINGIVIKNSYNLGSVLNVTAGNSLIGITYDSPNKITKADTNATIENCYYLAYDKADDGLEGTTALNAEEAVSFGSAGSVFVLNNNFTKTNDFSYPNIIGNLNSNDIAIYTLQITVDEEDKDLGSVVPAGTKYILAGEANLIDCAPIEGYTVDKVTLNGVEIDSEKLEFTLPAAEGNQIVNISFDIRMPEVATSIFDGNALYGDLLSEIGAANLTKIKEKAAVIAFATIAEDNYKYAREDFGFVIFEDLEDVESGKYISLKDKYDMDASAIGTVLYGDGIVAGKTYYIAGYAKFVDSEDISYGEITECEAKIITNTSAN